MSRGMVTFHVKGNFRKTKKFLQKAENMDLKSILMKYGYQGVEALVSVTPKDTGKTAYSWGFEVEEGLGQARIYWTNDNVNDGVNIALILQYGHGTRTGGWVKGRDYINPAIQPIFDKLAEEAWKEVTG